MKNTHTNTRTHIYPSLASLLWFHWLITGQGPRGPNSDHMSILCMFTVQQSTGMNVITVKPWCVYFLDSVTKRLHCFYATHKWITLCVSDYDRLCFCCFKNHSNCLTANCKNHNMLSRLWDNMQSLLAFIFTSAVVRLWMTSARKLKVTNNVITKTLQYIYDYYTHIP